MGRHSRAFMPAAARPRAPTNLRRLRIFHTLATTGPFTGAARRLGISQPAVTIQIRDLEDATGVRLLERGGAPFILREPGSTTRRVLGAQLERAGVVPDVVMELGSNETIKHAVAAGLGVAVVGARVIASEVAGRRLRAVRLRGRGLALRFHVCHHRDRGQAPVLRAFLTHARGRFRDRRPPA